MIDEDGRIEEIKHDMVVLSLGIIPEWNPTGIMPIRVSDDGFIQCPEPQLSPAVSDEKGIFVAGVATGPKDIPDSIVEASAAAMESSIYLRDKKGNGTMAKPEQVRLKEEEILSEYSGK
jgi:heterodisulfide reductase subunit A